MSDFRGRGRTDFQHSFPVETGGLLGVEEERRPPAVGGQLRRRRGRQALQLLRQRRHLSRPLQVRDQRSAFSRVLFKGTPSAACPRQYFSFRK